MIHHFSLQSRPQILYEKDLEDLLHQQQRAVEFDLYLVHKSLDFQLTQVFHKHPSFCRSLLIKWARVRELGLAVGAV